MDGEQNYLYLFVVQFGKWTLLFGFAFYFFLDLCFSSNFIPISLMVSLEMVKFF